MYRLLIVDDEPVIVEGLAAMLSVADLPLKEIKLAYSAKEALEYFNRMPFDIILADIRMPKMDGLKMIQEIRFGTSACKIIFLSGYSDFEYARQAVKLGASDYLLKPVDDAGVISSIKKVIEVLEKEYENMLALEKARIQMTNTRQSQKTEFFLNLLSGLIKPDYHQLREKFSFFNIPFNADKPISASIIFRIDQWDNHFNTGDEPLLQFAVENILNEILGESCYLASFGVERELVALIVQSKDETASNSIIEILRYKLEEAQDTIFRVLGAVVSFVMTSKIQTWSQWPEEANKLTANIKLHLGKGMLIFSGIEGQPADQTLMTEVIKDIIEAINLKDIEAFEKHFDRAAQGIAVASQGAASALGTTFMTVSAHMLDQARKYNFNNLFSSDNIEKMTNLYKHKNLEEMKNFMVEMLKQLINMVESYRKNPAEVIVSQVKNYINTHINEDLSLNVLARKVYMNSSYLSRIFSQHTQEQLSVYITRTKMEYAKALLAKDDLKIYEVSQKVGFENPNYFAKVFRKSYGISPQDFRALGCKTNN